MPACEKKTPFRRHSATLQLTQGKPALLKCLGEGLHAKHAPLVRTKGDFHFYTLDEGNFSHRKKIVLSVLIDNYMCNLSTDRCECWWVVYFNINATNYTYDQACKKINSKSYEKQGNAFLPTELHGNLIHWKPLRNPSGDLRFPKQGW